MPDSKRNLLSEDQVHLIVKALADRRRYEIVQRLRACENALACETVRGCMDISAATLSHHMKELETAGLVKVVRQRKYASYVLRRDVLQAFLKRLKTDLI
jgi:ArsR family transcriptional regulator, arsenate/arsenite/antimonite-responsive transcriptional repressor